MQKPPLPKQLLETRCVRHRDMKAKHLDIRQRATIGNGRDAVVFCRVDGSGPVVDHNRELLEDHVQQGL